MRATTFLAVAVFASCLVLGACSPAATSNPGTGGAGGKGTGGSSSAGSGGVTGSGGNAQTGGTSTGGSVASTGGAGVNSGGSTGSGGSGIASGGTTGSGGSGVAGATASGGSPGSGGGNAGGPGSGGRGGSAGVGASGGSGIAGSSGSGGVAPIAECVQTGTLPADPANSPANTIIAHADMSTGCIKYGGIGWLYALSETLTITDDKLTGLVRPKYTGQMAPAGKQHPDGDAFKTAAQFKRTGGLGMSIYVQDYYSAWPYQNEGVDAYMTNVVDKVTAAVKADPYRTFYNYISFNEPDWIWYGSSGTKLTNFQNDWKKVFDRIRATDPGAKIVGPNFYEYNAAAYDSFFKFAKDNNCLPDITSWHDLDSGPGGYYANFDNYRSIEKKYSIAPREIFINEYGRQTGEMGRPGRLMQYLARFERTKVYGGMAAWNTIGRLCDLLAPDGRPSGAWYLMQWYGQMTGNTIAVSLPNKNGQFQAMGFRTDTGAIKVIFGGSANDSDVGTKTVTVSGLTTTGSVQYEALETNWAGADKQPAYQGPPAVKASGTVTVTGGQATISVPSCKALSAYLVTFTP